MMTNRTRGARDDSKLNRTLRYAPPPPRFTRQPQKEKMLLALLFFAGGGFFLKRKGHFSFWGSALSKYSGSAAGRNADSVLPKLFSGGKDLAKPRLMFLKFDGVSDLDSARRKGSGE